MRPAARVPVLMGGALLVLGLAAAGAAPAAGQSLTSVRGLGYPLLPVDARTEVLDGLGIGLKGLGLPMTNPASPAGIRRRGFVFAVENNHRAMTLGDQSGDVGATRFPLLRMVFPLGDVAVTMGYGAVLDQAWGVVREGSVVVGIDEAVFTDRLASTGGLGEFQLGAAVPVGERFALGATVGAVTGNQRIRHRRSFELGGPIFEPFDETNAWRYSGVTAALGAMWDPMAEVRVGASIAWMGEVSADSAGGRAASRSFEGPVQAGVGASAYLSPTLLTTASARWSGWSVADGFAGPGGPTAARDTWEWGLGVELDNPQSRTARSYPIRAGFQYRQLPFAFGTEAPTEWFGGVGAGMRLGVDPANPLARLDLALQRGGRTAPGDGTTPSLEERIWRIALSISLFGN